MKKSRCLIEMTGKRRISSLILAMCLLLAAAGWAEEQFFGLQSAVPTNSVPPASSDERPSTDTGFPQPAPAAVFGDGSKPGVAGGPEPSKEVEIDTKALENFASEKPRDPARPPVADKVNKDVAKGDGNDEKRGGSVPAADNSTEEDVIEKLRSHNKATQMVYDEGFQPVEIAMKDISRIVCSADIANIVYSKEKSMEIKSQGRDAFVKNLPVESVDPATGAVMLRYDKRPKEVYVLCGGKTYSLLLIPRDIPATTIFLKSTMGDKEQASRYERAADYETTILRLIRDIYREDLPIGYEVSEINRLVKNYHESDIVHNRDYIGDYLRVQEYIVYAKQALNLDEIELLDLLKIKNPLAITLADNVLEAKQQTRVIVVRLNSHE
ncbi:MAG: type-F conjugative transfer system secretin TraK [Nitrospirae bacterium]|nr:type-F conjugative transfer system secretin TraK [Nitrospirota bacterium]MCL5021917.1 type-F conjugative transfer system secretin TraK [Nitrospirota bacterium]